MHANDNRPGDIADVVPRDHAAEAALLIASRGAVGAEAVERLADELVERLALYWQGPEVGILVIDELRRIAGDLRVDETRAKFPLLSPAPRG